jgi:uncharacterized repeat protein (TIGR01451 family)
VFYEIRKRSFSEAGTIVTIAGPDQIKSGKLITYEISYKNANRADISGCVLNLSFSEFFRPDDNPNFISDSPTSGHYDLGDIKSGGEGKIVFNVKAYSPKGALMYFKADLLYQPENFSGRFTAKDQLGINIISAPLSLEIQAPQNVANGDEINYLVSYQNDGEEPMEDIKIKIDYPEQFTFASSEPKMFEGNNIWYLGTLSAGESGKIVVSGKLEGEGEHIKTAVVKIGSDSKGEFVSFNEESADTKIIVSALKIGQVVNGSANYAASAGDTLQFEISFRNDGSVGLRDVIIRDKIDSPVIDYASYKSDYGGSLDADNKTITWKASDVSNLKNLESGEGGKISFTIKVKDRVEIASEGDRNFVISSIAKIDSPDVPTPISMNKIISGNRIDIKLNSKIILSNKGFYTDLNIPNTGPIPPKVGAETTYTFHWIVTNVNNDVTGAKVEANLSTGTNMTGLIFPQDAKIDYNERSNSIRWNIGTIPAGTGVLSAPLEVSFQVKIKPSPDQAGRDAELIGESKLTAQDSFTGEQLSKTAPKRTTHLLEDSSIGDRFRVVN